MENRSILMNNCSCGSSRCLLKVYVEGRRAASRLEPTNRTRTPSRVPQSANLSARTLKISNITSPARIKHPMKRRVGVLKVRTGEMRSGTSGERISWDEGARLHHTPG